MEEHQISHVPWKAWLFKCLHILNMSCTSENSGGRFFCATCSCSPIYIFLCTVFVTLPRRGQFLIILMIPEHCNTHKFLYARWSTFSGRFHTVSFTMQSHDQNSTSSLKGENAIYCNALQCTWASTTTAALLPRVNDRNNEARTINHALFIGIIAPLWYNILIRAFDYFRERSYAMALCLYAQKSFVNLITCRCEIRPF